MEVTCPSLMVLLILCCDIYHTSKLASFYILLSQSFDKSRISAVILAQKGSKRNENIS